MNTQLKIILEFFLCIQLYIKWQLSLNLFYLHTG